MQRTVTMVLLLSLAAHARADCELVYAPPEVRAAAQAFHRRVSERRAIPVPTVARPSAAKRPRVQGAATSSTTAAHEVE